MNNSGLYDSFLGIWGKKRPSRLSDIAVWDRLAYDWEQSMAHSQRFRENMAERIQDTAGFLRGHGLLTQGCEVLDIGCGPGFFAAEFGKTAGRVMGVDISPQMIRNAKETTAACPHISYLVGDFPDMDNAQLGGPYDLTFACITPAVSNMDCVEKMIRLSRKYCFYSCFVFWYDDLEKRLSEEVFGCAYTPSHGGHGRNFYALFNLLWLRGYYLELSYYRQEHTDALSPSIEEAERYARIFRAENKADESAAEKIFAYMGGHKRDGVIIRHSNYWYGRMFWDVREQTERPELLPR